MIKKQIVVILGAALLLVATVTAPHHIFAAEDYPFLEDMSIKELRALRDAINKILGEEEETQSASPLIEGRYYLNRGYGGKDPIYIEFVPDVTDTGGTFVKEGYKSQKGTYKTAPNSPVVTLIYDEAKIESYIISDNLLIPKDDKAIIYKNFPADKDRFKLNASGYYFEEDGTVYTKGIDKYSQLNGTYTKEGDMIICDFTEKYRDKKCYYFFIIHGNLYDSVLIKEGSI